MAALVRKVMTKATIIAGITLDSDVVAPVRTMDSPKARTMNSPKRSAKCPVPTSHVAPPVVAVPGSRTGRAELRSQARARPATGPFTPARRPTRPRSTAPPDATNHARILLARSHSIVPFSAGANVRNVVLPTWIAT